MCKVYAYVCIDICDARVCKCMHKCKHVVGNNKKSLVKLKPINTVITYIATLFVNKFFDMFTQQISIHHAWRFKTTYAGTGLELISVTNSTW